MNENFKDKINQLNDYTLDQEKFNSLISELIANMNLDENLDEEEKDDEQNNDDKQNKPITKKNRQKIKKINKRRCL